MRVKLMVTFFERLKKRKKEEKTEPLSVDCREIPRILDEREITLMGVLARNTEQSQQAIRTAISELHPALNSLREKNVEPKTPPRLRKAVETAVPSFTNTLETAISRQLSDDPEQFYDEAADLLKSLIKALKGQGRYITSVFPETMKEIRTHINSMGRAVNAITPEIAKVREMRNSMREIRVFHASLIHRRDDYAAKKAQVNTLSQQIDDDERKLEGYKKQLIFLKNRDEFQALIKQHNRIEDLDVTMHELSAEFDRCTATASSVMKKAEHIAQRENEKTGKMIKSARKILENTSISEFQSISNEISGVLPAIRQMIDKGTLELKNKTEKRLFSPQADCVKELRLLQERYVRTTEQQSEQERALAKSALLQESLELEKKVELFATRHFQDREQMQKYEEDIFALRGEFPELLRQMGQKLSEFCHRELKVICDEDLS
jgi:hypothetical protein